MIPKQHKLRQKFDSANASVKVTRKTFSVTDGTQQTVTTLTGYPILWNQQSTDRGGYVVQLATNSATFCTPTLALFNHDFKSVIGNTANNTLRIGQADATGIPIEIDLPDTTTGNDIAELVSKGYIAGMSFSMANGFEQYSEAKDASGTNVLTCTKFTVDEVTVTAVPAFTSTSIGVKDDEDTDTDDDANDTDEPINLSSRITASLKLKKMRLADLAIDTGRVSVAA